MRNIARSDTRALGAQTFSADSARFVFHGPTASPSSPAWTSIFDTNQWNSADCNVLASLAQQGTFVSGGVEAATSGSFDLNAFCTDNVCPGSLVQDCGFTQTVGVLAAANLRYVGKVEVWLENSAHALLVGFYDVGNMPAPVCFRMLAAADLRPRPPGHQPSSCP